MHGAKVKIQTTIFTLTEFSHAQEQEITEQSVSVFYQQGIVVDTNKISDV
jgi:hypothetical protein